MNKLIYIPILLLVVACGTTTVLRQIDGKEYRETTTKLAGIQIRKSTVPVVSHTEKLQKELSSIGKWCIVVGIAAGVASFAFSAAIKSYTGQELFNGLQIGSGCVVAVGISLVQLAAWWWYIVAALISIGLYFIARLLRNKGVV